MKRVLTLLAVLLVHAVLLNAQRPKPVYDPETREGLLIQHIQQETDPAEKLHFLEQFALQYPTHPAIAWVYDSLQPAYLKVKAWDDAMRVGEKRIALEPENLDAAKMSLKAAESKGSPEQIAKWADCTWRIAAKLAANPGRAADSEQTKLYAESSLYSLAEQAADPLERVDLLLALQDRNPNSPYVENIPAECFAIYKKLNRMDKALALADRTLASDPDNIDLLIDLSEYYFSREDHAKVVVHTIHMIEVLEHKDRPANLGDQQWQKKKSQLLGMANYMGGVSSSLSGEYSRGDRMLRAALPAVADDPTQEATVLYFLGLSNYKLADREAPRAQQAIQFWRRCAAIKSNFQAQALKNVDSTRSEFNLP